jgi:hypothetical protein
LRAARARAKLLPMRRTLPLLLLALAGCKAHMMETRGDKIQLFGAPEKPGKGGVIRYLANGPAAFRNGRKADAEKQMRRFCSGAYTVTAEGPRSKFGSKMPTTAKVTLELDEWWYVAFDCVEGAADAKP